MHKKLEIGFRKSRARFAKDQTRNIIEPPKIMTQESPEAKEISTKKANRVKIHSSLKKSLDSDKIKLKLNIEGTDMAAEYLY